MLDGLSIVCKLVIHQLLFLYRPESYQPQSIKQSLNFYSAACSEMDSGAEQ